MGIGILTPYRTSMGVVVVKGQIVLAIFMGIAPNALAETIGMGGGFLFGGESTPVAPRPPVDIRPPVARPPETLTVPVPKPRPQTKPVETAAPMPKPVPAPPPTAPTDVPFKASVAIGSTRCPEAIAHPNARNTPVKVYVNQQTQSVSIVTPDRPQALQSIVSTGGGLKIPNGKIKKDPYCARTPKKDGLIVSAVTPEMFEGTGCTPEEIRARSTVFKDYKTNTFTDKEGRPVPMPQAIRIIGGIFFHEVPPSYTNLLGHNVSGECIRLKPAVAKYLQAQIRKYGAIEVNITEPPEVAREMPQYCDDRMAADAKNRQRPDGSIASIPQATGTEDVYGGERSFFGQLAKINPLNWFKPQAPAQYAPPSSQPPRPSRPVAQQPYYQDPSRNSGG